MKTAGIQVYSQHRHCINNVSAKNDRPYMVKRNAKNISFTANVAGFNKNIFVQRNIIRQGDNLSKFVEDVFHKIYQHDPNKYTIIKNPPILSYIKDMTTLDYNYIFGSGEMYAITPTQIKQFDDISEHIKSIISKGIEYQKQVLECINKARVKIYEISLQYGFNPKELRYGDIDVKSTIYKRFDELLEDSAVKKGIPPKNEPYCDVLVLPDKENTDAVITFTRDDVLHPLNRYSDGLYETCHFDTLYTDSKIRYNMSSSVKIKTDDGNELSLKYWMPRKDIHFNNYNSECLLLDKQIYTLKSYSPLWHILGEDKPFYDIKDYKNSIMYTFKNNDGIDELVSVYDLKEDVLLIKNKAINFVEEGKIVLGTSLYTNLLQLQKPMGACIVLPYDINKSRNAIKQELEPHILNGIGTGFDLSDTDEPFKILTLLNEVLKEYDNKTQRPPAGIAILDVSHKDILQFINAKRNANFADWRFNISVSIPNEFIQKVANNDIIKLSNGEEIQARRIYNAIIDNMHYCGEPGIVFKDRVEAANPIPNHKYRGMASCAEIGLEDGEMCLFSHINLNEFLDTKTNQIDFQSMGEATSTLSRLLDNVIDINLAEKVGNNNIASQKRRFGIGVCGFADLLANMGVPYGSTQSQKILADCLEVINYSSKKASMELSKEKGSFPLFNESRYNEKDFLIKHSEGSPITKAQWDKLYDNIQKYGLRNATTTALPPTGSSSRIVGASYSIEPYFDLRNNRIFSEKLLDQEISLHFSGYLRQKVEEIVNKTGSCQGFVHLKNGFRDVFRIGNEINYDKHLKIMETAQKFVDDGISKTINLENSATLDDIDNIVKMAYDLNLKGITVFRDGCLAERKLS